MYIYTIEKQRDFFTPQVLIKSKTQLTPNELVKVLQKEVPKKFVKLDGVNNGVITMKVDDKYYLVRVPSLL